MKVTNWNQDLTKYINQSMKETTEQNEFQSLLEEATKKQDEKELKDACKQFEAYFLQQMFNEMKKTVPENTLVDKSPGREVYEDMLNQEYAKEASKGSGVGIAQMLYEQLSKDFTNKG